MLWETAVIGVPRRLRRWLRRRAASAAANCIVTRRALELAAGRVLPVETVYGGVPECDSAGCHNVARGVVDRINAEPTYFCWGHDRGRHAPPGPVRLVDRRDREGGWL